MAPEECVRLLGEHCWVGTGTVWPEGGRPEMCKHCTATRSAYANPPFHYVYPEDQP